MFHRRRPAARRIRTGSALLALAAALSLTGAAGASAAAPAPARADTVLAGADRAGDLSETVTARLRERGRATLGAAADGDRAKVDVTRRSGDWAFGTAVLATEPGSERMPEGWLFVAERRDGQWKVAMEGEEAFARISRRSAVVEDREKPLFAAQDGRRKPGGAAAPAADAPDGDGAGEVGTAAAGDYRTGMALPFSTGQTWTMTGGPHGWGGSAAPWSSVDFAGGDQAVRATRAGTAYTMCTGWVRVVHDRGYATDYYHLWNSVNVNGAAVSGGTFLGYTGTDVTCGGSATGRHVHLGLRQNGAYVGMDEHNLGKWVVKNGGSAYQGSAMHGSRRVYAGSGVYNYGALGFTQGIVDANDTSTVNKRSGPGTGYAVVGSVSDGATVTVSCSSNGTSHTGRWGATSLWNKLSDGTWISDAYLWTGVNGAINGYC
ncbi:M23 family metallopeptidase [Streptomyces sp. HB2AG]|uniref:M23 family metallopeptidase n=1 Tax=Streptomyces sp. HB2AG TaxID=2983400 RepID=UPI0022AA6823|nr:peptidoglycan DD-metalloendopeptidase family protein [Streptomyces sp. HB2AG]MCZ2527760.1 hypothetical protein [Streptomyces sp. HB2AG]